MSRWTTRPEPQAAAWRQSGAWLNRTIADDARHWAEAAGDADVFPGEPETMTYARLLAEATALGAGLRQLGVSQGDSISFMIPNWVEAAVINLAAAIMGFIVVPIVPIYREAETRFILRHCDSRVIFVPTVFRGFDYAAMIRGIQPELPNLAHVIGVRGEQAGMIAYAALLASGEGDRRDTPIVDPDSIKMALYTSGTTGAPKAVLHSHNTLARAVAASAAHWHLRPGEVVLMPSPVTHVSGYSNGLERPLLGGTRTVLMESWNADAAVALIDRHHAAMTVAATPFLVELVAAAKKAGTRLDSLRVFACGGAAVPPELIRLANATFAQPCAFRVYGSSEAPFVTLGPNPGDDASVAAETDGRALDFTIRIVDEAGDGVAEGEIAVAEGEIAVAGPALFLGYAGKTDSETDFTSDGYFRTGDLGRITPDGALVITGRKKDLIIRGGENISAKEIEDVLNTHPLVIEASVVAAPHPRLGEGVHAFLITVDNAHPDIADLALFLQKAGLARQKCPEGISIVDDLPRTASGKVRKDRLRARLALGGAE